MKSIFLYWCFACAAWHSAHVKPLSNKDGNIYKFEVEDESTKLPATVKLEVKVVKSANYEAYKASKEKFDLMFFEPTFTTSWTNTKGEVFKDDARTNTIGGEGISAENVDQYFELHADHLGYAIEGTFSATDNGGCTFKLK